jgi:glycosyltransferase involved in cell wall biosynthesis
LRFDEQDRLQCGVEDSIADSLQHLKRAMEEMDLTGEIIVADNNSNDRTAEIAKADGAQVVFEPIKISPTRYHVHATLVVVWRV